MPESPAIPAATPPVEHPVAEPGTETSQGAGWGNLAVLAVAQALGSTSVALQFFVSGLVGSELAPALAWATLPVTTSIAGSALSAVPAALLMKRIGRRAGFTVAALVAALAGVLAAMAIGGKAFGLFCAATALIGGSSAFVQQYRFAAAEVMVGPRQGIAVAVVLGGGVVAGLVGPQLGTMGRDLSGMGAFAGSFLILAALQVVVVVLLRFYRSQPAMAGDPPQTGPRRTAIAGMLLDPVTIVAILAACGASGVMTFSMTGAPLGMNVMGHHNLRDTGFVIQSHIVAMYLPSFFTGFLVARLGPFPFMLAGCGLLLSSGLVAMLGTDLGVYWTGLVLLGLGWNLLFLGGTTLLARSQSRESRFAIQGLNDLLVAGVQAGASLLSSVVLFATGWRTLNVVSLGAVLVMTAAIVVLRRIGGAERTAWLSNPGGRTRSG